MMEKEKLFGKTLEELTEIAISNGLPKFTGKQLAEWMYQKGAASFEEMTNISKKGRSVLEANYEVGTRQHLKVQTSADGTKKYLFPSAEGHFIESAYIPENNRNTLCISSQVGCKMGCLFCATGKQGFQANLTAGEIVNQVVSLPERENLTNLVFMGMGEPLDNPENLLKALEILTSDWGVGMSPRRITVSTIGILPAMKDFLDKSSCHFALSIHTPFEEERRRLMPIENVYPLPEVMDLIKQYDWSHQRRISFEYIMFKGINDTRRHVNELVRILHGLRCRINLMRFHPVPATPLEGSDEETLEDFKNTLNAKGITATIRASRGLDIDAACGLLSTKELLKEREKDY